MRLAVAGLMFTEPPSKAGSAICERGRRPAAGRRPAGGRVGGRAVGHRRLTFGAFRLPAFAMRKSALRSCPRRSRPGAERGAGRAPAGSGRARAAAGAWAAGAAAGALARPAPARHGGHRELHLRQALARWSRGAEEQALCSAGAGVDGRVDGHRRGARVQAAAGAGRCPRSPWAHGSGGGAVQGAPCGGHARRPGDRRGPARGPRIRLQARHPRRGRARRRARRQLGREDHIGATHSCDEPRLRPAHRRAAGRAGSRLALLANPTVLSCSRARRRSSCRRRTPGSRPRWRSRPRRRPPPPSRTLHRDHHRGERAAGRRFDVQSYDANVARMLSVDPSSVRTTRSGDLLVSTSPTTTPRWRRHLATIQAMRPFAFSAYTGVHLVSFSVSAVGLTREESCFATTEQRCSLPACARAGSTTRVWVRRCGRRRRQISACGVLK